MSKKTYLVEITETYTARVLIKAENMDDAYEVAEGLVNDDVVDPVKLALKAGDYSRDCEVVKQVKNGDTLPDGIELFA